jgi:hypothetical protein
MMMFKVAILLVLGGVACSQETTPPVGDSGAPGDHSPVNPSLGSSDGNLLTDLPADKDLIARRSVTEETSLFQLSKDVEALKGALENEVAKREIAEERVTQTMNALNSAISLLTGSAGQFSRVDSVVESIANVRVEVGQTITQTIAQERSELNQVVTTGLGSLTTETNNKLTAFRSEVDTLLANAKKEMAAAADASKNLAKCADQGQYFDPAANVCRTTIWSRFFNNDWGGENGYVPNRRLTFTKWRDDTDLKITYFDNFRVHGHHWCRASWYVEIDRKECTDPGRISYDKYSHQQHDYWMNDHIGGSANGICKGTSAGKIKKGTHVVEIRCYTHRCDTYTGHSGQGGYIIVEEVMSTKVNN